MRMNVYPTSIHQKDGLQLRDLFAAKAMQSLLWNPDADLDSKEDVCKEVEKIVSKYNHYESIRN